MRPKYVMSELNLGKGSPHQLSADLHLVDWLHERGVDFDVITDEDLHHEGLASIEPYKVVLTGTHPEYWSGQMLDAVREYLAGGGRLMYLGGNGLYWVTQLDPEQGHTIEIRRLGPSTRTWEPEPGEGYLSTTGEPGGLWRHRGRAPQRLVGVGFTAQGAAPGRPYERLEASFDPRVAFIFEGVDDGPIGDFASLVNDHGAAGYEIDRFDHDLGTPRRAFLLATASGFSGSYQHVSEEIFASDSAQGGPVNPLVRADMVFLEYPNGGAVFSTGSIAWCGSLSYNGYDNAVSRITGNVLDEFASR
jgi:N,N-dimethylformamidase